MDQVNHLIKQKFYALNFTFSHFLRQKLNGHVQPLPREAGRGGPGPEGRGVAGRIRIRMEPLPFGCCVRLQN